MTAPTPGQAAPDRVKTGGLMRCCLETIDDLYPDGPAAVAVDGQQLQCKYGSTIMVFRDGFWRWLPQEVTR